MDRVPPLAVFVTVLLLVALVGLGLTTYQARREADRLREVAAERQARIGDLRGNLGELVRGLGSTPRSPSTRTPADPSPDEGDDDEAARVERLEGRVEDLERDLARVRDQRDRARRRFASTREELQAAREEASGLRARLRRTDEAGDSGLEEEVRSLREELRSVRDEVRTVRALVGGNPSQAVDPALIRGSDLAATGRFLESVRELDAVREDEAAGEALDETGDRGFRHYREVGSLREAISDLLAAGRALRLALEATGREAEAAAETSRRIEELEDGLQEARERARRLEEELADARSSQEAATLRARSAEGDLATAREERDAALARVATLEARIAAEGTGEEPPGDEEESETGDAEEPPPEEEKPESEDGE